MRGLRRPHAEAHRVRAELRERGARRGPFARRLVLSACGGRPSEAFGHGLLRVPQRSHRRFRPARRCARGEAARRRPHGVHERGVRAVLHRIRRGSRLLPLRPRSARPAREDCGARRLAGARACEPPRGVRGVERRVVHGRRLRQAAAYAEHAGSLLLLSRILSFSTTCGTRSA